MLPARVEYKVSISAILNYAKLYYCSNALDFVPLIKFSVKSKPIIDEMSKIPGVHNKTPGKL